MITEYLDMTRLAILGVGVLPFIAVWALYSAGELKRPESTDGAERLLFAAGLWALAVDTLDSVFFGMIEGGFWAGINGATWGLAFSVGGSALLRWYLPRLRRKRPNLRASVVRALPALPLALGLFPALVTIALIPAAAAALARIRKDIDERFKADGVPALSIGLPIGVVVMLAFLAGFVAVYSVLLGLLEAQAVP